MNRNARGHATIDRWLDKGAGHLYTLANTYTIFEVFH